MSEALPLCGKDDGGGLSLDAAKVDCTECRRIAELGPPPDDPPQQVYEFLQLDEFTTCEWFATCPNGTTTAMWHLILGHVPICGRCAARIEVELPTWE